MKDNSQWGVMCNHIQQRLLNSTNLEAPKATKLRAEISKVLIKASNERILKNKLPEILSQLKMTYPSQGKVAISGGGITGKRNFKRLKEVPHFECFDGSWFDFSIMVDESISKIIGFDFEIRFPESSSVGFLRFDFNLPEHNNEVNGLRFHIHPGNDDLMIPSAPMDPLEILHLFLYGLQPKGERKPRSTN